MTISSYRRAIRSMSPLVCVVPLLISGCGGDTSNNSSGSPTVPSSTASTLPNITTFAANPSTTNLLDAAGLSRIDSGKPYGGSNSACPGPGVHLFFGGSDPSYTVDIHAPAAGTITRVDTCLLVTSPTTGAAEYDRYGITMKFAQWSGADVLFDIALEPVGAKTVGNLFACSGGVSGRDNGFYRQYILASVGAQVSAGQVIARLYHPSNAELAGSPNEGRLSTLDFKLLKGVNTSGGFSCPNIFSQDVVSAIASRYGSQTCNGTPYPATLCYQPGGSENIVTP